MSEHGTYKTVFVVRNIKRFRGGLAFKALRLVHHSTLGSRVIKKNSRLAVKGLVFGVSGLRCGIEGLGWRLVWDLLA